MPKTNSLSEVKRLGSLMEFPLVVAGAYTRGKPIEVLDKDKLLAAAKSELQKSPIHEALVQEA